MAFISISTYLAPRISTEDEISVLIVSRVVPDSFRGGPEDAVELLDLVEGLWTGAERCYRLALGRVPNHGTVSFRIPRG